MHALVAERPTRILAPGEASDAACFFVCVLGSLRLPDGREATERNTRCAGPVSIPQAAQVHSQLICEM